MTDADTDADEVQEVVEEVDDHLQTALTFAEKHMEHGEVRPTAAVAFDAVEQARLALDKIDDRKFVTETDADDN